jgi:hypothetical protein
MAPINLSPPTHFVLCADQQVLALVEILRKPRLSMKIIKKCFWNPSHIQVEVEDRFHALSIEENRVDR